jgi:hypothetical protein
MAARTRVKFARQLGNGASESEGVVTLASFLLHPRSMKVTGLHDGAGGGRLFPSHLSSQRESEQFPREDMPPRHLSSQRESEQFPREDMPPRHLSSQRESEQFPREDMPPLHLSLQSVDLSASQPSCSAHPPSPNHHAEEGDSNGDESCDMHYECNDEFMDTIWSSSCTRSPSARNCMGGMLLQTPLMISMARNKLPLPYDLQARPRKKGIPDQHLFRAHVSLASFFEIE